jgi:hypothetical protein
MRRLTQDAPITCGTLRDGAGLSAVSEPDPCFVTCVSVLLGETKRLDRWLWVCLAGSSAMADNDFWYAVGMGELAEVQRLVGEDPRRLHALHAGDRTPLIKASGGGHVGVVQWPSTTRATLRVPPWSKRAPTTGPPWRGSCWRGGPTPPSPVTRAGLP